MKWPPPLKLILALTLAAGCQFDTSGVTRDDVNPSTDDLSHGLDLAHGADAPLDQQAAPGDASAEPDQPVDGAHDLPAIDSTTPDTSAPDGPTPDTVSPVDPLATFGTPKAVTALNTSWEEDDPTLTGDMLEIYFEREGDILRSKRSSVSAAWGTPQKVSALCTNDYEGAPGISPDGLAIFFNTDRPFPGAKGGVDFFTATRASRSGPWSVPSPLPVLSTQHQDYCSMPTPDLLTLVLDSNRPGGPGNRDIYRSTRSSVTAPWSAPTLVAGINSSQSDECPWPSHDLTVIYFASSRSGGSGSTDIWVTTRSQPGGPLTTPVTVKGVNSSSGDGDPWLSPDMRTIYFASTRNGSSDIFVATR